jgi:uncharacterized protein (TIGR00251 family)
VTSETYLSVRVTPRSARDEFRGWRDGALLVRLRAPPVEGAANDALRRFLARQFDMRATDIEIVSGTSSRTKRVRLTGLSEERLLAVVGKAPS